MKIRGADGKFSFNIYLYFIGGGKTDSPGIVHGATFPAAKLSASPSGGNAAKSSGKCRRQSGYI
jgi:hypothetical protein